MGLPERRPQAVAAATSPAYACLPFNLSTMAHAPRRFVPVLSGIGYKSGEVKVCAKSPLITKIHKNAKISL